MHAVTHICMWTWRSPRRSTQAAAEARCSAPSPRPRAFTLAPPKEFHTFIKWPVAFLCQGAQVESPDKHALRGFEDVFFFFFCCFRPLRLDVLMLLFYFMFFLLHALPTALSPSLWCFMFVFSFIGMWKKKYNNLAADQIVSLQQFRPSRGSGRGWIFSVAASPGS